MTVASINSTVTVVVTAELGMNAASSYAPAISKVSEALESREYDIVDAITETAHERYGVSRHEVAEILHEAGLSRRPAPVAAPEPAAEYDDTVTAGDVAAGKLSEGERIARLEEGQALILGAIKGLTELAKRHLGANL